MHLIDLADVDFVSLTTFRRNGDAVPTPVWIARDQDALVLITPVGTGKLKRLAHTSRVTVAPCSRRGRVDEGAPLLHGSATVVRDPAEVQRIYDLVRRKYGLQFKVFMLIERLVRRGSPQRVGVRISPA